MCALAAACGGARSKAGPAVAVAPIAPNAPPVVPRKPGPMKPVRATAVADRIARAGLDPKDLPPLEKLTHGQRDQVMRLFSETLGVPCIGCHAEGDMRADTARKRVAKRMYNEITRVVATDKGEPVFCDSCHQGGMWVLDRADKGKISDYMSDQHTGGLKAAAGGDVECDTCHGGRPEFTFLTEWKSRPAPDLAPPPPPAPAAAPAPTPATTEQAAAPHPPTPPVPAKRPARKAGACGDKNNLCPLQKWMRANVAVAVASDDAPKLAAALAQVATMAPDASWTSWREMSLAASEAAKRGDMKEARKSCRKCHGEYRDRWRTSYRARAVK